jgi:hypothetical protein
MAKTLLSIQDLRWRAFEEIRQQPGCSSVASIAINRVTDDLESSFHQDLKGDGHIGLVARQLTARQLHMV